jgi:acyl-CoA thioesterase-1
VNRNSGHYPLERGRAWLGGRGTAIGALVAALFVASVVACPAADRSGTAAPTSTDRPRDEAPRPRADARPAIVFLGTSLTAGYGLPESEAYPALIEQRLAAAGLDYRVVNAGVSGDTSAGGLRRLDWLLRLPVVVLVVELGANDMLRGQSVEALEANLVAILEKTRAAHPGARFVIEGMRAAPNLGREYGAAFDAVYPRIAERFQTAFVPFLLEDVVARRALNQADGIHPTAEGHALIAERVWRTLEPVVREVGAQR